MRSFGASTRELDGEIILFVLGDISGDGDPGDTGSSYRGNRNVLEHKSDIHDNTQPCQENK